VGNIGPKGLAIMPCRVFCLGRAEVVRRMTSRKLRGSHDQAQIQREAFRSIVGPKDR
jgi:hypothetical protein